MTLEQLCHSVESTLYGLGKRLWKGDPQAELREEADQLSEELQQGYAVLERSRSESEALSRRLAEREAAAAMLASRVETYVHVNDQVSAWRHALELDRVRGTLNRDRARLVLQEHTHRTQQERVARLEGDLAGLLETLYPR